MIPPNPTAPPRTADEAWAAFDACLGRFDLDEARRILLWLLEDPGADRNRAHFALASLRMQEGFTAEALALLRGMIESHPSQREAWSTYLTALKTAEVESAAFVDAHRLYAAHFIGEEAPPRQAPRNGDGRQLHVGVIGADGHLAIPRFLSHLAHSRHRTTLFARHARGVAACAARWPELRCVLLPAGTAAAVAGVEAEKLDVLIDLCGHGPGGRLDVLAARPAPVSATWLDYLATTGVPAVQYRISDWVADPPGNDALHAERLARLPFAAWCYQPYEEAPGVRTTFGPLTLGSACIPLKMTDATLALWRRVLEALPQARFVLVGFMSNDSRQRVLAALGEEVAARTVLHGRLPLRGYLEIVDSFDLALDTVGFSGGTSTLDCLWQGVPVVTLPGVLSHSRSSASLLRHLGLDEGVAATPADYVERAVALAARAAGHDRAALRERLRASTLCDAKRFARGFDDLLSHLWLQERAAHEPPSALHRALRDPLDATLRRAALNQLAQRESA